MEEAITTANKQAKEEKVEDLVQFEVKDFTTDDSWVEKATILYLYQLPKVLQKGPFLASLTKFLSNKSNRILSYEFDIPSWSAAQKHPIYKLYMYNYKSLQ